MAPFRSMRARIILWNAAALAVMFLVLGLFVRVTVNARLMASVDREMALRMRALTPVLGRAAGPPRGPLQRPLDRPVDHPVTGPFQRPLQRPAGQGPPPNPGQPAGGPGGQAPPPPVVEMEPPAYRARVMDAQGRALVPPEAGGPWDRDAFRRALDRFEGFTTIEAGGVRLRVLTRPVPPFGRVERVIQVAYPLTDVQRAMSGLSFTLLALVPLVLFCAGWGGSMLTDRVLRPVRRITEAAGRIEARDMAERLPVEGEDEFARLASTFNAMLTRLSGAFGEQERLVEELRRMVEQQRRFTADASHELRTPLTVIKANTSLALGGGQPDAEEGRQAMADIDRAADAASRLVDDLLLLARSDAGQLGRDSAALPVREVLERAIGNMPRREAAPVRLEVDDPALQVMGNEDELVRVFLNLLQNAARHTPPDGSITVTARREGGLVRVRVSDTGCGIAPEHLPHLGERFYRVDAARTRKQGGSGLGLSICRGILEAHGGSMRFESAPGAGTTVTVTLPAVSAVPPGVPALRGASSVAAAPGRVADPLDTPSSNPVE